MVNAFVTGWPIDHSLSPYIHEFWIQKYGLEGSYKKRACSVEDFSNFVSNIANEGFVGGNVTIPHKEAAYQNAEILHPSAKKLGAVNTVWLQDGKLHAANTDGYGFLANLESNSADWDNENAKQMGALVLGAGGASRAIVSSLVERGFEQVLVLNRTLSRAQNLILDLEQKGMKPNISKSISFDDVDAQAYQSAIVVNTTSLGMHGSDTDHSSPIDISKFQPGTVVNDIVYTPLETPLLKAASTHNMIAVDGLGMLLHQAVPGFEKWFGVRPEVTSELKNFILTKLQ